MIAGGNAHAPGASQTFLPKRWKYARQIRNFLAPNHVIYVDESNWLENDPLFDDPLHRSAEGVAAIQATSGRTPRPRRRWEKIGNTNYYVLFIDNR
jgi:hypothetical protein